jgi:hypothetical protein
MFFGPFPFSLFRPSGQLPFVNSNLGVVRVAETFKDTLWKQLGASLDMLENAMIACPDDLWTRPSERMGFWYMVYHSLFFLHYDLSPAGREFEPAAFDIYKYEYPSKPAPFEHPYSKKDLASYFQHCRRMCAGTISTFETDDLRQIRGCQRLDADTLEVLLYQMRHIQHHAAQLNLLLRQTTDSAPGWIHRAKIRLEEWWP